MSDISKDANERVESAVNERVIDYKVRKDIQERLLATIDDDIKSSETQGKITESVNTSVAKALQGNQSLDEAVRNKVAQMVAQVPQIDPSTLLVPPGTIMAFAGDIQSPPTGWLPCDGRSLLRNQYPQLFKAIGTAWGNPDQNLFKLPDLRGMFLRGVDGGKGIDPDKDHRSSAAEGGNQNDAVGSFQSDELKRHDHALRMLPRPGGQTGSVTATDIEGGSVFSGAVQPAGGAETRPKNVYVNFLIKF